MEKITDSREEMKMFTNYLNRPRCYLIYLLQYAQEYMEMM